MHHFSWMIFVLGIVRVCVWWFAAGLAWWRRRWAVCAGFVGAGLIGIVNAVDRAHGHVGQSLLNAAILASTPVAVLIVCGFITAQPKHAARPRRWSP